jgi:hypothetical protein
MPAIHAKYVLLSVLPCVHAAFAEPVVEMDAIG